METKEQAIGEQLRLAREALGLSKRRAAHQAGVSEARWRQVESGVQVKDGVKRPANTTPETLVRMARGVGADAEHLLELAGFPTGLAEAIPEHQPKERPVEPQDGAARPPQVGSKVLDLSDCTDREIELVDTFLLALKLGRKMS